MDQDYYNCENMTSSQRTTRLFDIEHKYGPYSKEADSFRMYLLRLDMDDTERRGMPDIDGPSAVNGRDYNPPRVSYFVMTIRDYWSEGHVDRDGIWVEPKHFDVIYKIVYGPFATKGQALDNIGRANRRNSDAGLQGDCWVPEPKYLAGKKWFVQVAAFQDLNRINDMLKKLGFKNVTEDQFKPKEETKPIDQGNDTVRLNLQTLWNKYLRACEGLHSDIASAKTSADCDNNDKKYQDALAVRASLINMINDLKARNYIFKDDLVGGCMDDLPDLLKAKRKEIEGGNQYDPTNLSVLLKKYWDKCTEVRNSISSAKTIADCDISDKKYQDALAAETEFNNEIANARAKNFDPRAYVADCLGDVPDLLKAKRKEIEGGNQYDPTSLNKLYKQYQDKCTELHTLISSAKTPADCDNNDKKYQDALAAQTGVNNEIANAKAKNFDTKDYGTDCLKDVPGLLSAKRKEIEGQNKPLDLNDQTVKDSVDKAIGSINKATDPDKLDTLTDVTNANKVIQTTRDYASGLYNLDLNKDQLEQVGAFENKINGHKKRLDDALGDRELYLRTTQNGAKDNDNKKISALAAGQGTISVPGIDPQALQQGRNKLTGGSGDYKVSLGKDDLPIMGEKRVIAFLDIAAKLYEEENVRDEAKNKFYKKILKALGNKNTLSFENSYQLEHDTQYVFAATLSLFWAYVFVNAKGSIFDSDFTGKGSTLDKIMNGQIKRSDVTISEYQYQKVAQGAE